MALGAGATGALEVRPGRRPAEINNIPHKKYTYRLYLFQSWVYVSLVSGSRRGINSGSPPVTWATPFVFARNLHLNQLVFLRPKGNLFILELNVRPACQRWNMVGAE